MEQQKTSQTPTSDNNTLPVSTSNKPNKFTRHNMGLKVAFICVIVFVVVSAGGCLWKKTTSDNKPFTANTFKQTNFVLYYPTVMPSNYHKLKGSENIYDNILFFDLTNGKQVIKISEQKVPTNPPNLDGLLEFKKVQTIAGKAVIGKEGTRVKGVLLSTTTLITISGGENVPDDVVGVVIQSLQSVSR